MAEKEKEEKGACAMRFGVRLGGWSGAHPGFEDEEDKVRPGKERLMCHHW